MVDTQAGGKQEGDMPALGAANRKREIAKTEVQQAEVQQAEVDWDHEKMTTNFANVVNIQSSPEQLDICFGTNHTWNLAGERRVKVELTNRIIMSPLAAKRMHDALDKVLKEHESRYGPLTIG